MTFVFVLAALSLTIGCLGYAWTRIEAYRRISVLDWMLIGAGVVYGLVHLLLFFLSDTAHIPFWIEMSAGQHLLQLLLAGLAVIMAVAGWHLAPHGSAVRLTTDTRRVKAALFRAAILFLTIAGLAQFLYTRPLGGFIPALEYSILVRSGIAEVDNPFSALARLPSFGFAAFFILIGLWVEGRRTPLMAVLTAAAFGLYLYTLLNWMARLYVLYLATSVIFGLLLIKSRAPARLVLPAAALGIAGIWALFQISVALNLKGQETLANFVTKEFSFAYIAFASYLREGEFAHLNFASLIFSPFYFLPGSMMPDFVPVAADINTVNITGAQKGAQGNTSGMPVDLVTLGLMQFGVAGVIVTSLGFGWFLAFVQRLLDSIPHRQVRCFLGVHSGLMFGVHALFYADPYIFLKESFGTLFSLLMLGFVFRPVGRGAAA